MTPETNTPNYEEPVMGCQPPAAPGEVSISVDGLISILNDLESLVHQTREKLVPVLHQEPSCDESSENTAKQAPSMVPLAYTINDQTTRIKKVCEVLATLNNEISI